MEFNTFILLYSLQKKVKDTMHKVFWDVFAQNLQEDPPDYSHAMVLLSEIREVGYFFILCYWKTNTTFIITI